MIFNEGGEDVVNFLEQEAAWKLLQSGSHAGESGIQAICVNSCN